MPSVPAGGELGTRFKVRAACTNLLLDAETARLTQELEARGLSTMLLKGPGTARWLYADDEVRAYSDIDLLIRVDDLERACEAMQQLGYEERYTSETERRATPHARSFVRSGTRARAGDHAVQVPVDLHWSFHGVEAESSLFWAVIERESQPLSVGGVIVRIPGLPARSLLVALHAAINGPSAGKSLADLERALERVPSSVWREADGIARELGAREWFVAGLALLPAGAKMLETCGIATSFNSRTVLYLRGARPSALGLERLAATAGWRERARLVGRELVPTPTSLRMGSRLATRGRLGLVVAYLLRPGLRLAKAPVGLVAVVRARRLARAEDWRHGRSRA